MNFLEKQYKMKYKLNSTLRDAEERYIRLTVSRMKEKGCSKEEIINCLDETATGLYKLPTLELKDESLSSNIYEGRKFI